MLTTEQVAERLQLNKVTVQRWLAATPPKLKGIKLGNTRAGWRVAESEVERFLKERAEAD